ncbi:MULTISPECIES: aconitase/3-isopropylmalate dehydratase large subunit family protein [Actinosynnema]|uniref:aconitase/3-isopropylmalate dehydratase large subunit family protein n=1 Tax=Actinosynnema TaxID=40566 RepID=UPI0020A563DE|nr:aconitase/3-isopropylmalate dehydratase large subunit family protein [Actinosynnema pretiosum]
MSGSVHRLLADLAGREVSADDVVTVDVARVMAHDGSGPVIAETLRRHGISSLAAADRAVFVFDHYYPPSSVREATLQSRARAFAAEYGIPVHAGEGIAHQLLPELGLVHPGTVVVGADSHTCTGGAFGALAIGLGATDVAAVLATGRLWLEVPPILRIRLTGQLRAPATGQDLALRVVEAVGTSGALGTALEFFGPAVAGLPIPDRMKLANHAVEMGAVCGLFGVDETCRRWLADRGADLTHCDRVAGTDDDGSWDVSIDLADVEPVVALPSRPDKVRLLSAIDRTPVDQVFIGSCAGGRLEDLHEAADVLRGHRVADGVRLLVGPASAEVLRQATADGTIGTLLEAGATLLPPGCGACLGRSGTLGDDDVCVSTQNRNFVGRSGSASARIFLGSPTTAAGAALDGNLGGGDR